MKRRLPGSPIIWIVCLSTALKLALLWPVAGMAPQADEREYLFAARAISTTGVPAYLDPSFDEAHFEPVFPHFLAACRYLAGDEGFVHLARLVQVVLSSIGILFVYGISRRFLSDRGAAIAAGLTAFNPTQVAFTHYFWSESLYTFFLLATVLLVIRSQEGARWKTCLGAGLVGGMAALTRSAFAVQIPVVLAWVMCRGRGSRREQTLSAALFAAGCLAVILPWSVRNTVRFGRFLLISTNGGMAFAMAANPIAPANFDLGFPNWFEEWNRYREAHGPDYEGVIPLSPRPEAENIVERNDISVRRGLVFMLRHPGLTVEFSLVRLKYIVNPTSYFVRSLRLGRYPYLDGFLEELLVLVTLSFSMFVMGFFALGLFVRPWPREKTLLAWIVLGNVVVCALLVALSRYRAPLVPLMTPVGVDAFQRLGNLVRQRRNLGLWLTAGPVLALLVLAWVEYLPLSYP